MKTRTVLLQPKSLLAICGITTSSMVIENRSVESWRLTVYRLNEATEIFFIGIGDAFYGVANLLINRGMLELLPTEVLDFLPWST